MIEDDRSHHFQLKDLIADASMGGAQPGDANTAASKISHSTAPQPGPIFLSGQLIARGWKGRRERGFFYGPQLAYFVTIDTASGTRTIWDRGLERAFAESKTQPQLGDVIGVRGLIRHERSLDAAEILKANKFSHAGSKPERWVVEKQEFFLLRQAMGAAFRNPKLTPKRALQGYPELERAYSLLAWIALATNRSMAPSQSKQHFVRTIREAIASRIERGYPIPQVPDHFYPAHLKLYPGRADERVRG